MFVLCSCGSNKSCVAAATGRYRHHLTTVSKAMFQRFACSSSHLLCYGSSVKNTPRVLLLSISRGSLLCSMYVKMWGLWRLTGAGPPTAVTAKVENQNERLKTKSFFLDNAAPVPGAATSDFQMPAQAGVIGAAVPSVKRQLDGDFLLYGCAGVATVQCEPSRVPV